jgi:8-oxo-dGTP pyrophosphatase MutT (NUDIX family)
LCAFDFANGVAMTDSKDILLWSNEWMEVLLKDGWYTFFRTKKGDGVCVLGFRFCNNEPEYLVRVEHTPPHGAGLIKTSLTGGIEQGETALETAVKELKEESGYEVDPNEMIDLGWMYPTKQGSDKVYLYAVNLDGKTSGNIIGDGSKGEEGAYCLWMNEADTLAIPQAGIGMAMARLHALWRAGKGE